jgi:hypothetical protein
MKPWELIVLLATFAAVVLWSLLRLSASLESKAEREADDPDKEGQP